MHIKIICIYCIYDDFLSAFGLKDDKQCLMTSAEILTMAIVSALFVDSMPVEVCLNVRSYRCRLLTGKPFIGYCKVKKKFYC